MTQNKTPMITDVRYAHFDGNGQEGFWWPVSQGFLHELRDDLLKQLRLLHKKYMEIDPKQANALGVVYIEIVRETLVILRSEQFFLRAKEHDIDLQSSEKFPYLQALESDSSYLEIVEQRFSYLKRSQLNMPLWKRCARYAKLVFENLFCGRAYKRKPLKNIKEKDTATFALSPFIKGHMKKENYRDYVLCSFWEWFAIAQCNIPRFEEMSSKSVEIIAETLSNITELLEKKSVKYSEQFNEALPQIIASQINYALFYGSHLDKLNKEAKIPKTLWFGGTNGFYPRLLRQKVLENGGYTVGHDHGRGFGMGVNFGECGTIFDYCSEFVTYSEFMASELEKFKPKIQSLSLNNDLTFKGVGGVIVTVDGIEQYKKKLHPPPLSEKKVKTALIMMPAMMGEHIAGLNTLPPDHIFCDFYAAMIGSFESLGYNVIMKRHPEVDLIPNESLFEKSCVEVVGGFVENILHDVDIIAFDFLSSAFKTQIMTEKPLLFFDFGFTTMEKETQKLFNRRVGVLPCSFNGKNRAEYSEGKLKKSIDDALNRAQDKSFISKVFGVTLK